MTTFTKEQAQAVFDLKAGYTLGHTDVAILQELARIALASLEAEAVAYIFKHPAGRLFWSLTDESNKGQSDVMPVYTAPPAPVSVPDNSAITQHFDTIALEVAREIMCDVNRRHEFLGGDIQLLSRIQCRIDDACRAAMLHGADGNSPVIQDGWVLVPMKLTAENGAKGALLGEFSETKFINCPECFGDDECDTCDGSGRIETKVQVSWTNIKAIWAKGIEHFSAAPQQEVKNG
ncbi:TPA: hypothetical protein ACV5KB_000564 [Enterobacter ludwigii]